MIDMYDVSTVNAEDFEAFISQKLTYVNKNKIHGINFII